MVSSGSFDVVFLDVHLPDGDGLEALPTIRQDSTIPEVIIITGEGDAVEIAEALRELADTIGGKAMIGEEGDLDNANFEDLVLMTEINLK